MRRGRSGATATVSVLVALCLAACSKSTPTGGTLPSVEGSTPGTPSSSAPATTQIPTGSASSGVAESTPRTDDAVRGNAAKAAAARFVTTLQRASEKQDPSVVKAFAVPGCKCLDQLAAGIATQRRLGLKAHIETAVTNTSLQSLSADHATVRVVFTLHLHTTDKAGKTKTYPLQHLTA